MSQPLRQPRSDASARVLGTGFLLGGGGLVGYQNWVVAEAVAAQEEQVSYSMAALVLGAMAAAFGVFLLVRGLAAYTSVRTMQQDPKAKRRLMIASVAVALVAWGGMPFWLSSRGYGEW